MNKWIYSATPLCQPPKPTINSTMVAERSLGEVLKAGRKYFVIKGDRRKVVAEPAESLWSRVNAVLKYFLQ